MTARYYLHTGGRTDRTLRAKDNRDARDLALLILQDRYENKGYATGAKLQFTIYKYDEDGVHRLRGEYVVHNYRTSPEE